MDDKTSITDLDSRTSSTGANLADSLAQKVLEAVDGFPAATDDEKAAIARLCARELVGFAEGKEG